MLPAAPGAGGRRRPRLRLAAVADGLRANHDLLTGSDPATDVHRVLSWSYRNLSPAAATAFRQLAYHPGADVSTPAAASLTGLPIRRTHELLDELAHASVLVEPAPGRFAMHDLPREYARHLAGTAADRRAAVRRALDHYLHTGHAAAHALHRCREPIPLGPAAAGVVPARVTDQEQAMASLDRGELGAIPGLNDFFRQGSCLWELEAGRARKLLEAFRDGRWRRTVGG